MNQIIGFVGQLEQATQKISEKQSKSCQKHFGNQNFKTQNWKRKVLKIVLLCVCSVRSINVRAWFPNIQKRFFKKRRTFYWVSNF